jgi:hypothetical protein
MQAAALTVLRELMCIRPAPEIGSHRYLENDIVCLENDIAKFLARHLPRAPESRALNKERH